MKKKILIFLGLIILVIIIVASIIVIHTANDKKINNFIESENIYKVEGNLIYDLENENKITSIINDTVIQGIVELKHDDSIYIFGGQHFGEYGYKIESYTSANIENKNQTCIDYISKKEYDTSYIDEGDVLICTGDLAKKGTFEDNNYFDTKENPIVVLKKSDYSKMQENILESKSPIITIGDMYIMENITNNDTDIEGSHLYIEYDIEDNTNTVATYHFPFAEKVYITDKTEVIGELKEGKRVKVQYSSYQPYISGDAYQGLELKTIEVIK